jgi:hypothetical protein
MEDILDEIKKLKMSCVSKQEFELAAHTRNIEKKLMNDMKIEFFENLNSFSNSLENVVNLLQEQSQTITTKINTVTCSRPYSIAEIHKMKFELISKLHMTIEEVNKLPFYKFEMLYDLLMD